MPNALRKATEPENFDKEFVRLAYAEQGYRGDGPIPAMPDDLWIAASERYIRIYEMLTGQTFEPGAYPIEPRLIENLIKAEYIRLKQNLIDLRLAQNSRTLTERLVSH